MFENLGHRQSVLVLPVKQRRRCDRLAKETYYGRDHPGEVRKVRGVVADGLEATG